MGGSTNAAGERVVQTMQTDEGLQKGSRRILQERGLWVPKTTPAAAVALLKLQPDFCEQKCWLAEIAESAGHQVIFFPKFHCEFNWIERYWGAAKAYTREHCTYNFAELIEMVPVALDSVSLSKMRKFECKAYRYMDLYRQKNGVRLTASQVEWSVKVFKSHRRVSDFIFKEENGVCKGVVPKPKPAVAVAVPAAAAVVEAAAVPVVPAAAEQVVVMEVGGG